jgi:hypothetical protein
MVVSRNPKSILFIFIAAAFSSTAFSKTDLMTTSCDFTQAANTSIEISCEKSLVKRVRTEIKILSAAYGTANSKECFVPKLEDNCYDFSNGVVDAVKKM